MRFPGAYRPRTYDAHDAVFRRADARIRRTQFALTRRETRVTTLSFLFDRYLVHGRATFCPITHGVHGSDP